MTEGIKGDRLAIIGCGAATERLHLPALRRIGWEPVLLVDLDLGRARRLAEEVGASSAVDHTGHLGDFDAALIATPHSLHAPLACALLEHGKAVFVEKPMATTAAECERMVAVARSAGLPVAVGLVRRRLQGVRWVKALLDSGKLGRIESFDIRDGSVFEWMVTSDAIWRRDKAGGGVLMDLGTHVLDLLLWWLGPAAEVAYKDDSYGGVEADCLIELVMESGARGTVELSRTRNLRQSAIIRGDKGRIEVRLDTNLLRARPRRLLNLRFEGVSGRAVDAQSLDSLFDAQLREWRKALTEGLQPEVPGSEAAASVDLIERAYQVRQEWALPWVRRAGSNA